MRSLARASRVRSGVLSAQRIVDEATSILQAVIAHEGGDVEGFLDREEERYRDQLTRYAAAFRRLEDRPIKAALYYPLVPGGWRAVHVPVSVALMGLVVVHIVQVWWY